MPLTWKKGQATTELTRFRRVIGVDPSESMIVGAREYTKSLGVVNCEYVKSTAEDLRFLEDGSVDLIIAGGLIVYIHTHDLRILVGFYI
jgi:ubiquinone/menaquinone biosynthesis C-methylase UbiE